MVVCSKCGGEMHWTGVQTKTLVAYYSPAGHDHDDNCIVREYRCICRAWKGISIINKCHAEGCTWRGKTDCFCSTKVDAWP